MVAIVVVWLEIGGLVWWLLVSPTMANTSLAIKARQYLYYQLGPKLGLNHQPLPGDIVPMEVISKNGGTVYQYVLYGSYQSVDLENQLRFGGSLLVLWRPLPENGDGGDTDTRCRHLQPVKLLQPVRKQQPADQRRGWCRISIRGQCCRVQGLNRSGCGWRKGIISAVATDQLANVQPCEGSDSGRTLVKPDTSFQ